MYHISGISRALSQMLLGHTVLLLGGVDPPVCSLSVHVHLVWLESPHRQRPKLPLQAQATAPTLRTELTRCRQGQTYAAILGGAEPEHDFVLRRHPVHAPDADGQRAQHGHSPGHCALPLPSPLLPSRLVSSPWHEANPPGMCKLLPFDVS
jgi:hypothetical protein